MRGESKQDTSRRRGGQNAATEQVAIEQRLFAYLSNVADAASGRVSPASRSRLVERLRETITSERDRHGHSLHTLERILDTLGDPVTLVDAEVQRDPEYQARLSARLTQASAAVAPRVPLTEDVKALIAPGAGAVAQPRPQIPAGGSESPEICLDPDPFLPDSAVESVGALGAAPQGAVAPEQQLILLHEEPEEPVGALSGQLRTVWADGPRRHPQEAIAIALFLIGALLGEWFLLLPAALVACTSRFYSGMEKWTLTIGVPIATALVFVFGFWLHQHLLWGGRTMNGSDLLSGAASFFGPLPSAAGLLAALYLSWRLARGIMRRS